MRGRERLEEVVVAKLDEQFRPIPGTERVFKVDTLVLSVGLIPQVELIENLVVKNPTSRGVGVSNIGQTSRDWIFSAGNCTVIFDLVDYVSYEGETAGRYAAKFVKGEIPREKIPVRPGKNVMVVHPIWYTPAEPLTLYLRVKKPMEKGRLVVGRFAREFEDLVPSEMLRVKISDRDLEGLDEIVVSVEEVN